MTEYPLDVDEDRWKAIKATIGHDKKLNDELLRRIELVSFGARYTRSADSRGRVSIPDVADQEVELLVLDVRDPEEADDE